MKRIKSALISVFYKDGLKPIIEELKKNDVTIYSTGGTQRFIEECGAGVVPVEDLTSYPSILGGRVKTLHPKVFGGILARRDEAGDVAQLQEYEIPEIDLVIVDLYPFEETVKAGGSEQDIIEKIDIGGISLIRAAAKNYKDTLVVASRNEYDEVLELLQRNNCNTEMADRRRFAAKSFNVSSHYDTAIFNYFNQKEEIAAYKQSQMHGQVLRYGENPHQQGYFYGDLEAMFDKLHGKELSYNNLVDVEAAVNLIDEFEEPTFVIIKHTNACGIATRNTIYQAYVDALACDNVSAFGGILIANRTIDKATAEEIDKLFVEVLIAPDFEQDALDILMSKKNRRILKQKLFGQPKHQSKSMLNGILVQDFDTAMESKAQMTPVTEKQPTDEQFADLEFALKAVKHLKSNTITLVKNKQLIGMGCGQTSRVDALRQGIEKAKAFGFSLEGAVMASDAFFPFPDCVEIADQAGVVAVVQPGGSIKDQDSIDYCNAHGMAMVTTGVRHFKH